MALINMTLYRLLVKQGADEAEAEQAARLTPTDVRVSPDPLARIEASLGTLRLLVRVLGTLAVLNLAGTLAVLYRLGAR